MQAEDVCQPQSVAATTANSPAASSDNVTQHTAKVLCGNESSEASALAGEDPTPSLTSSTISIESSNKNQTGTDNLTSADLASSLDSSSSSSVEVLDRQSRNDDHQEGEGVLDVNKAPTPHTPSSCVAPNDNPSEKGRPQNNVELKLEVQEVLTKVYKRRWVMLFLFALVSMVNAFQWIQFSIITSVLTQYYTVDSRAIDWTSLVYMVVYIPLIFPGAFLMDRVGLRWTLLIGALGTTAGAWIKCLSVSPDRFYVAMIGQTVAAISQVFILGVPPNVAAVWFGPDQVSSACSIGVFGNQVGVALGFLVPPLLVKYHEDKDDIGTDLSVMYYIVAGTCTTLFLAVLVGFQEKPPLPPNVARSQQSADEALSYPQSIKRICTNWNYILLLTTYGVNVGVFYAMSTLLNQTVLVHFPGEEESAGWIGLTIVVCGMVGSVLCGVILDRTHKFKEITLVVYVLAVVGMVAYTFTFRLGAIEITFVTAGFVGLFMTGYLPVGFEFAAELTYPEPEVTSSGLLNASAQLFGIIFTLVAGWLLNSFSDTVCNGTLSGALLVGAAITLFIRPDLKRQRANQATAT